jgi:hypothetical protein
VLDDPTGERAFASAVGQDARGSERGLDRVDRQRRRRAMKESTMRSHSTGMARSTFLACALVALAACGRSELLDFAGPSGGGTDHDGGGFVEEAGPSPDASHPDAGCGPATCPNGCCDANGECVTPTDQSCGLFGEACTSCGPNQYCKGSCITPTTNCGPENCGGCCAGASACADGVHGALCGHGGEQCTRCDAMDGTGTCKADPNGGGVCLQAPTCSPGNCNGCCYGNVCAQGTQNIACGRGGQMCQDCSSSEETCVNGQCQ